MGPNADDLEALALILDKDFETWRATLTPAERCDLVYYQAWGFFHINRSLRGLYDPKLSPTTLRQVSLAIRNIDAALERVSLLRALTVYRGVVDGPATLGMALCNVTPGTSFGEEAYLSTSLDPKAAQTKAGKTPASLILKIEVPAGQPAAWFGQIGKKVYRSEYELLLPRQLRLKVLDLAKCGSLPMLHVMVITDE